MSIHDLILHRANSPLNVIDPYEQVKEYVGNGFTRLEVDIYALTDMTYKFCHPLDQVRVDEVHNIHDGFLLELVNEFPSVEWYVDLKCLDLDTAPIEMMEVLIAAFGKSAIFVAGQRDVLEFMHDAGMRTARYSGTRAEAVNYEPDFSVQRVAGDVSYPKQETILFCDDVASALEYQAAGYGRVMVDADLVAKKSLIEAAG